MKIYTKTGDEGQTGFIGGRVSKASQMIEVVGDLDEVNATLGVVISYLQTVKLQELAQNYRGVQKQMFDLGMIIASPMMAEVESSKQILNLDTATIKLETQMDDMDQKLAPLQNFILPGGAQAAAHAHLARTVCRRAEREMVKLITAETLDPSPLAHRGEVLRAVQKYLNRLSDWLFTTARFVNSTNKIVEEVWTGSGQMPLQI